MTTARTACSTQAFRDTNNVMARAKKSKHGSREVMYIRVTPEVRESIEKIAAQRGYPHTVTSVAFDMITKGLRVEASQNPRLHKKEF